MAERIRVIRLYGELGRLFGRAHHLAVQSSAEAVKALGVLLPGFSQYLSESKDRGLGFAVFYGKRNIGKDELGHPSGAGDIRIAPVVQGRKSGGGLQVILGVALIAAASFFSGGLLAPAGASALFGTASAGWATAGMIGISLAVGGVAQMVTGSQAKIDSSEAADNRPSYNFSGIKNTITQGNPVPLCYGEMTTGSAQLSLGIRAEDQQ
ncbi:tail assembly protein [Pseudomonas sp. P66]|uniref:Tail assembly protein n=2 Tax=Pseudomonas TaxID=286 RepID=A0AB35WWN6_9PSED|nr:MULTISPECIES: tail assembly protein [Pseudomonas]MBM5459214.1 tail assembly protein [Pseudomonas arcuscaelestis]MEE1869095.1 tail assembly protein [Pseudomonas sp. 120P]MEE1959742.1 tail assembly protein [Pseudomonas sp. 119P]